jgi:nucleoside-diphosphate-sugar epimerase
MTGATGFIGRNFIKHNKYHKKVEIDAIVRDRNIKSIEGVDNIFYWSIGNIMDYRKLQEAIVSRGGMYDAFLHGASIVGNVPNTKFGDYYNVNVGGTELTIGLSMAFEIPHYVYLSTGSVYGNGRGSYIVNSPRKPIGPYATTKYIGELLCREYFGMLSTGDPAHFPISSSILRIFYPYGNDMQLYRYIPSIFGKVKNNIPVEIDYPHPFKLNPIHVDDVCRHIDCELTHRHNHVINVAGKDHINEVQIAELFGDCLGIDPIYKFRKYDGVDHGSNVNNEFIGICPDHVVEPSCYADISVGLKHYAEENR